MGKSEGPGGGRGMGGGAGTVGNVGGVKASLILLSLRAKLESKYVRLKAGLLRHTVFF